MRNDVIKQLNKPMPRVWEMLNELWRDDRLLGGREVITFSANPANQNRDDHPTEFGLFSDVIYRKYPTYLLNEELKIVPGPETPRINLAELKSILLSKDLARNAELDWTKDNLRFLDASEMIGDRIAFSSWPRTGNSMTRNLVEAVTGVYTGADMDLPLTCAFHSMGMAGEIHTPEDRTVWITKTHFPSYRQLC